MLSHRRPAHRRLRPHLAKALCLLLSSLLLAVLAVVAAHPAATLAHSLAGAESLEQAAPTSPPTKSPAPGVTLPTKTPRQPEPLTPTSTLTSSESTSAASETTPIESDPQAAIFTESAQIEPAQVVITTGASLSSTVEYTPTFAEVACPFVTPWSQTIICGNLTVPEVRNDPNAEDISLFVMILKSDSTPLTDPIIVLPGGPGSAGSQSRNLFYSLPSHRNRDIVLLDPRGTGYSYPSLDCFELNSVGITYANSDEANSACHDRLLAEGRNLAGYVSSEQVEDVADLAKVLGFGKINLYATSYGTRIAVLLADRYPMLVRSMVLDGVLPVAVNSLLEEPLNDYGVLQRVVRDCAEDPRCNGSFPALEARLLEVIDRYNAYPLPDDIGYGSGDDILKFIFKQLYDGGSKIPAFITALYYEDFAQACALLPPSLGCFFADPQNAGSASTPLSAVPLNAGDVVGIDILSPEITARWVFTWANIIPIIEPMVKMPSTEDTAASDQPASELPDEALLADAETSEDAPEAEETPAWRAHFDRPEDPLSPDLDRISWLLYDLGYDRTEELFAYLDTLNEEEAEALLQSIPAPTFDSFSEGVYASVMCAEEAPFYTLDDIADLAARIPQQFGSLPTRRATEVKTLCEYWQMPVVSAAQKMTLPSAVPTLIINGTHDAMTPAAWAERAAIYLDNVWLRLFPGYGHAILSTGDACVQEMVGLFYTNPEADPTPPCYSSLSLEFVVP